MAKSFTQHDLLRFIYREVRAAEGMAIVEALLSDSDLNADYETLLEGAREVPKVLFRPRQSTIDSILRYSREQPELSGC